jgi:hypothetical protein
MCSVAIKIRLLAEVRDIYCLQSIQTGAGAHAGSSFLAGKADWGTKLTTHLHLVLSLRKWHETSIP